MNSLRVRALLLRSCARVGRPAALLALVMGCGADATSSTAPVTYFDSGLEFPAFPQPCTLGSTTSPGRWEGRYYVSARLNPDTPSGPMPLECVEVNANTTLCRWGRFQSSSSYRLQLQLRFNRPLASLVVGSVLRAGDDFVIEGFRFDSPLSSWPATRQYELDGSVLSNVTFTVREVEPGVSDAGVFTRYRAEIVGAMCRGYESFSLNGEVAQTNRDPFPR